MKTKILFTLIFIVTSFAAFSQPLPPSTPSGTPVPVGNILLLLIGGIATFVMGKKAYKTK